jgi:GT2 family glycosyltransferase/glycosyltransferase involved in cell wall biosynthesis
MPCAKAPPDCVLSWSTQTDRMGSGGRLTGRRSPAAHHAFDRAQKALAAGDVGKATKLYEYAQRLQPSDGAITIAVGLSRLLQGDPKASEPFEQVAHRYDLVDAWLGLVAVHRMVGRPDLALKDLAAALSRHGVPCDQGHLQLYDSVVAEADEETGWCAVSNTGVVTVTLVDPTTDLRTLEVQIDGRPLARALVSPPVLGTFARFFFALPQRWRSGKSLTVTLRARHLVGSPHVVSHIGCVEGFVRTRDGGIEGWAWFPNDREIPPRLMVSAAREHGKAIAIVAREPATDVLHPRPFASPRQFALSRAQLDGAIGALRVCGPDGRDLYGSPLDPGMELRSATAAARFAGLLFPARRRRPPPREFAMPSVPASIMGVPTGCSDSVDRKVDVIIPVYAGLHETLACIDSVLSTIGQETRCVVVDDCSPDPDLIAALTKLSVEGRIELLRNQHNKGFPGTANAGMRFAHGRDVVLLNSDTLVATGWLEALRQAVQREPNIGTATPLSNNATVLSYPNASGTNEILNLTETKRIDALARRVNAGITVDIPTGVGFCMYIRRQCLDSVGLFREDAFAQGYGEETDFCIRARHMGWRHVAVPGVFVAHVGGESFGSAKAHLIERNLDVLNQLHPGYDALIAGFQQSDPLRNARRALDEARWHASSTEAGSVIVITHNRRGGVLRHVTAQCEAVRERGQRAIVLTPAKGKEGVTECLVAEGNDNAYPNLRYKLPAERDQLLDLLRNSRPSELQIHHFIGHDASMLQLPAALGVPYHVVVHDYAWLCPRVNLVDASKAYCGEPDVDVCEVCIEDNGNTIEEMISPAELRARSKVTLERAVSVVVPSVDTSRRLLRHFDIASPCVGNWGDDTTLPPLLKPARRDGNIRVCLAGAIGIEKGYEFLLACARYSARHRLPVEFTVVGYTCDDRRLLDTNCVTITGEYEQAEVVDMICAQKADIGLLPAVWPETWCYALSELWMAGLPVLAFDLGAPADRIRMTARGWLVPLGTPPEVVVAKLINLAKRSRTGSSRLMLGVRPPKPTTVRPKRGGNLVERI